VTIEGIGRITMEQFQLGVWLRRYRIKSDLGRKLVAEFVATTLLMYMGFCIGAQTYLSKNQLNTPTGTSIGWGLSLIFAVQLGFNSSGSHLNPVISFSAWVFGRMSLVCFLLYTLIQTLACSFAAALTFILYYDKINDFDGGIRQVYGENATAGIFATYPGEHLSLFGSIIDQISCTCVLTLIVGVICDERNKIPKCAQPTMFGLMLISINLGFGLNAGNAMNPARDFGPRLFTLLCGYGIEVFSYRNYTWFLIPIICPFIGGLLGSLIYQIAIGVQIEDQQKSPPESPFPNSSSMPSIFTFLPDTKSKSTLNSLV